MVDTVPKKGDPNQRGNLSCACFILGQYFEELPFRREVVERFHKCIYNDKWVG